MGGTIGALPSAEVSLTIVAAAGTVAEAGTVQAGITGTRPLRPKEVHTWRSRVRPMRSIPSQRSKAGRTPHLWSHRRLGGSAQLIVLVGSARASVECAAAGTIGALPSAEVSLTIVAAAGTVAEAGTVQAGI